jgi:hypothetical protein
MSAYDRLGKVDRLYSRMARRAGVPPGWSSLVIEAAVKAKIPRSRGLALIQTESGFANVFGHDPTIFGGAGHVTEVNYHAYKRERGPHGRGGMQGVGPAQLTYWSIQDEADRRGGCWRPEVNMRVAFDHLRDLCRTHGVPQGLALYNGQGEAARRYSLTVRRRERQWKRVLLGVSRKVPA